MLQTLIISQVLLWVLVIALALVCVALARQVGVLHARIAPAGALSMNRRLAGGDVAPPMTVPALDGALVQIGRGPQAGPAAREGSATRSQLLFFLSPTCPVCKTLLPAVISLSRREREGLEVVLASDGLDEPRHQAFIKEHGLEDFPYVLSSALGMAYGVSALPYAVLIDGQGRIAALGLVNSREHLESLLEAQRQGAATLQAYRVQHASPLGAEQESVP